MGNLVEDILVQGTPAEDNLEEDNLVEDIPAEEDILAEDRVVPEVDKRPWVVLPPDKHEKEEHQQQEVVDSL